MNDEKEWFIYEAFRRYDIILSAIGDIFCYAGERICDAAKEAKFPTKTIVCLSKIQLMALIENAKLDEVSYTSKK